MTGNVCLCLTLLIVSLRNKSKGFNRVMRGGNQNVVFGDFLTTASCYNVAWSIQRSFFCP